MNPDVIEDYESDEDHPQSNPFPGADKVTWTRTFSVALHETTGLPLEITDGLANIHRVIGLRWLADAP